MGCGTWEFLLGCGFDDSLGCGPGFAIGTGLSDVPRYVAGRGLLPPRGHGVGGGGGSFYFGGGGGFFFFGGGKQVSPLRVRRRSGPVSNHEATIPLILRDAANPPLLGM